MPLETIPLDVLILYYWYQRDDRANV